MDDPKHTDNVYAYNSDFNEIHISHVPYSERGTRMKYFCLGCNEQMQAVKPIKKRAAYFRHHTHPNSPKRKCTYSDESYRHKLAKDILEINKSIKVPKVYKYDPDRLNPPVFVKDSEIVMCHKVLKDHHLFEDVNGRIQIRHKPELASIAGLWVKPDVIFLDKDDQPILLIEIVATHKVDVAKQIKYKRLGIDTVAVTIPKDSPESIENVFSQTSRTKWIYNYDEERADYLRLSNSDSKTIPEVDELQRKLFEETFKCRKAEVGELIRSIERLLETEQYKEIERNLGSEIQRIERASDSIKDELEELRKEHGSKGIEKYSRSRKELTIREKEFQEDYSDLEGRYSSKKQELDLETKKIESESGEVEQSFKSIESRRKGISSTIREERELITRLELEEFEFRGRASEAKNKYREDTVRLREQFDRNQKDIVTSIEKRRRDLQKVNSGKGESRESSVARNIRAERTIVERTGSSIEHHRRRRASAESTFKESIGRIERDIGIIREGNLEKVREGNYRGSRWFDTEYERLGEFKRSLILYKKVWAVSRGVDSLYS